MSRLPRRIPSTFLLVALAGCGGGGLDTGVPKDIANVTPPPTPGMDTMKGNMGKYPKSSVPNSMDLMKSKMKPPGAK